MHVWGYLYLNYMILNVSPLPTVAVFIGNNDNFSPNFKFYLTLIWLIIGIAASTCSYVCRYLNSSGRDVYSIEKSKVF